MKLDEAHINYIQKIINASKVIGVDEFKISDNAVSALNDQQTAVLFQPLKEQQLPFATLGMIRVPLFNSRLQVLKARDGFKVEAVESPNNPDLIQSIKLKSKGANVDFRVANPTVIRAPKSISDKMQYAFELSSEDVKLISSAASIMPTNGEDKEGEISFTCTGDGVVSFEILDSVNGSFVGELDTTMIALDGSEEIDFFKSYPLKTLMNAITNQSGLIKVGVKGMMNVNIDGISVYILPRA